jgi:hydrogenase expression/formation protein HypC
MCLSVPAQLISISENSDLQKMGKVNFGGVQKDISLIYVPDAKVGDYLTVHAGFALTIIDEEKAAEIFQALSELEQLQGLPE